MTSSYDTDQADAIAQATSLWDPDTATVGDLMDYDTADQISEQGHEHIGQRLAERDMTLADDGGDLIVVWQYRRDGSRIEPMSPPPAEARQTEQPVSEHGDD
jgi:hypothetical protein